MKKIWYDNYTIIVFAFVAFVIGLIAIKALGFSYSINSDDLSYINSGIIFKETGKITMHGVISAQIMPGMTFIIALFVLVFGQKTLLLISLKVFWLIMGLCSIIVLYRILRLYTNKWIAILPCLFFLAPDFIWTNNLILTETPFMLSFLSLTYHSLRFIKYTETKDYWLIIVWYVIGIFIRPTIGLVPIGLAICLLIRKYDFKELLKKGVIAGTIVLIILMPWIIRNYIRFNRFVPLTYGVGNPLLLGTYQGEGYPLDESLDYKKNVDDKMPQEMRYYLSDSASRNHKKVFYLLKYDELKAKYRMSEWWKNDKLSMLKSYLVLKPKIMLCSSFYWDRVFNISDNINIIIRKIELCLFIISCIVLIITRKYLVELFMIMFSYLYHIALYSYTFAYGRYAISLLFLRFIIIGLAISTIYDILKKRRINNESINNNSGI